MNRITALLALLALLAALAAGCAHTPEAISPCVGVQGSPCTRSPLPNQPMELPA